MPLRIIKSGSHASGQILRDTISSIFALELFAPSRAIYLISPWITDAAFMTNDFGQFRVLLPDVEGITRLSVILNALASHGCRVHILTRPQESEDFLLRLDPSIERKVSARLHEKSLTTDHFYLRGSLNFTYMGLNRNDEHVEISTDVETLAIAQVHAKTIWASTA